MFNLPVTLYNIYRFYGAFTLGMVMALVVTPLTLCAQTTQPLFLPLVLSPNLIVSTFDDELNADGDCALREAIVAANTHNTVDGCQGLPSRNFIWLPIGVYSINLAGAHEDAGATGDFDITSDLTILGEDQTSTRIDGSQLDRVFHIHANSQVTLRNLTIHNGKTTDGAASTTDPGESAESGAGLANFGELTLIAVIVRDNLTGNGGAGKAGNPEPGQPGGNGGNGGALYNNGVLTLRQSTLTHNQTGNGGENGFNRCQENAGTGGALFNDYDGLLTLIDTTLSHNQTGRSGLCQTAPNFINGGSGGDGGSLANLGSAFMLTSAIYNSRTADGGSLTESATRGGNGGRGGGIFNLGEMQLANSTISSNQTGKGGNAARGGNGGNGAGIYTTGKLTLDQVTLTGNQTGRGGTGSAPVTTGTAGSAGGLLSTSNPAGVFLRNTIIAGNTSTSHGPDCSATLQSRGYNLVGNTDNCKLTGDLTGNLTDRDPRLAALADNGGPTQTHALPADSPAINSGSCTNSAGVATPFDQRGAARLQGATCDMGAFEAE